MRPHHHGCSKELDSGAPREHSNKSSGIGGCGCGGATQQSSNPPARNKSESAMSSMSELGVKSRLSYTLSNKEDDSLELESLKVNNHGSKQAIRQKNLQKQIVKTTLY